MSLARGKTLRAHHAMGPAGRCIPGNLTSADADGLAFRCDLLSP
jgi:hypothetical protein